MEPVMVRVALLKQNDGKEGKQDICAHIRVSRGEKRTNVSRKSAMLQQKK